VSDNLSEAQPVLVLSLALVVCVVFILMGAAVATGRWKSPVRSVYPGVGSGLLLVGTGLMLMALGGLVGAIWPLETTPESFHPLIRTVILTVMPLGLLTSAAGFSVGWWARPRWLLPRWQREELARRTERESS
jgi:Na+-transporting NADH:ubiquinone oxidoreductase subunit NqrD